MISTLVDELLTFLGTIQDNTISCLNMGGE